jgi:DNA-binding transcriptional LysR family regulator
MASSKLQNVDLNLLLPLKALLEERSVGRAAKKVNLSQPAMSRALERLRATLGDELLIRSQGGYILTPRAAKLLQDMDDIIPQLETLWNEQGFSPLRATDTVRIVMNDVGVTLLLPLLTRALPAQAPGLRIDVVPWSEHAREELTNGTADLVLSAMAAPPHLRVQRLYDEKYVCVLANTHPYTGTALTIEEYLNFKHIEIRRGYLCPVDRALNEGGYQRDIRLQLPFFVAAIAAVQDSDYVLTCPARLAQKVLPGYAVRTIPVPPQIPPFSVTMMWHPRLTEDGLHSWFREFVLNSCASEFGDARP